MNNDSQFNKGEWKMACLRVGFVALACAMWISAFMLVCGNNGNIAHTKRLGEVAIVDLQVPASLFH